MIKTKTSCPEDLFAQAIESDRHNLSEKDLRLLVSGLTALHAVRAKPINHIEMMAVTAMVAYAAYQHQTTEEKIRTLLTATFNVADLSKIPAYRYQQVIEYLADLEIPKVLN